MSNLHHVIAFDPGGITGWAHFAVDKKAFINRDDTVIEHIKYWDTGEFEGPLHDQIRQAVEGIRGILYGGSDPNRREFVDIVTEGFQLTQIIGGDDLLIPVRWNALIEWEAERNFGLRINYQDRKLRTSVTDIRLERMGFQSKLSKRWTRTGRGKDSFAAMQHAITWLKRTKEQSRKRPWK